MSNENWTKGSLLLKPDISSLLPINTGLWVIYRNMIPN
jgi:phage pi2 protein 07